MARAAYTIQKNFRAM